MKQVRFVQLEANAFLADRDFQAMTATERGVYWTLILYLYCNNGRVKLDFAELSRLCACEKFKQVWRKIKKKFLYRNGFIEHKRVNKELRQARKRMQAASEKGVKAANARWHRHSTGNAQAKPQVCLRKGNRKGKEKYFEFEYD